MAARGRLYPYSTSNTLLGRIFLDPKDPEKTLDLSKKDLVDIYDACRKAGMSFNDFLNTVGTQVNNPDFKWESKRTEKIYQAAIEQMRKAWPARVRI